ncbi:MAG: DegT/DnrJ/EryC1/StrS family aminotransferase, partial [Candidatus Eremiobacteraeota bacterium]|nr:DegT/DnrJ/EryC1/StrS family aminotransferase [Candidatus Eremiobacteraeota bacterium]
TFNLDPDSVKEKITERTGVIIPVHYGGQVADMDRFRELASRYNLRLVEDAAESHGAVYKGKRSGALGDAAIFSFTPIKNMTTGEGGMITTNDKSLADELRILRNHGQSGEYLHVRLGYNYRMTEMQAAIGRAQLKKLPGILKRKNEIAALYREKLTDLPGIIPPKSSGLGTHPYMIYAIRVIEDEAKISRDRLMKFMKDRGIQVKVYFPPVHTQPVFKDRGLGDIYLPVTERISKEILCLPCHGKLTDMEIGEVVDTIKQAIGRRNI